MPQAKAVRCCAFLYLQHPGERVVELRVHVGQVLDGDGLQGKRLFALERQHDKERQWDAGRFSVLR